MSVRCGNIYSAHVLKLVARHILKQKPECLLSCLDCHDGACLTDCRCGEESIVANVRSNVDKHVSGPERFLDIRRNVWFPKSKVKYHALNIVVRIAHHCSAKIGFCRELLIQTLSNEVVSSKGGSPKWG